MRLELSSWARRRLLVTPPIILVFMLALPSLAYLADPDDGEFLIPFITVAAVWTVVVVIHLIHFSTVRYRVDHGVLHRTVPLGAERSVPLAGITAADPCSITYAMGQTSTLQLRIGQIRITLGTRLARSYWEPEALRAIADGLQQSSDPRARVVADSLRKLATDRTWQLA
jgi:hypothetical protein